MDCNIDIAVCGNITIDYIIDKHNNLLPPLLGGNAFYTAISASLWGYKAGIVSKVGSDFPLNYFSEFLNFGIDIGGISKQQSLHESISGIQYYENDERRYFNVNKALIRSQSESLTVDNIEEKINGESVPEALPDFDPKPSDIPESYYRAKGISLCSMVARSQHALAKSFRRSQNAVCVCDGSDYEENPLGIEDLLSEVDYFIPSEAEVSLIAGDLSPREAVDYFISKGPELKAVIIKLGHKGAYGYDRIRNKHFHLPVFPWSTVIDTTGAGDSFCGGFITGILETDDVTEAAKRAAVTSSVMIERYSSNGITGITRAVLEERLHRYNKYLSE